MIKDILKDWRVILVIICLALALYMIFPRPTTGVLVKSVAADSPLVGKLKPGEILNWANEMDIKTPEDLLQFENFTGTFRFMHNGKLDLAEIAEPGLKITVVKVPSSRLSFGMDMVGGTRILLKPVENVSDEIMAQTISTLETRINIYGLRESKFQSVKDVSGNSYIQIEMAGGSREEIDNLLAKQGRFEAKIPKIVAITNNSGNLRIADNNYSVVVLGNDSARIADQVVALNSTFDLNGIKWQLLNITNSSVIVGATVFNSTDIKSVCMVEQAGICTSRVMRVGNVWQFEFGIQVSDSGAQRFADVTKGMRVIVDPNTGDSYLESQIYLFLDDKPISQLNIDSDLGGKITRTASITGTRETQSAALAERRMLQSVLSSGALPVQLTVSRVDSISASLGAEFMKAAGIAALTAAAAVSVVVFIRYRRIKIVIPMLIWDFSEAILILGAAAAIGWTIDLASIAGLIAALGTGTNDQIMMVDEILLGRKEKTVYTVRQRLKRALFIVFGAAGTIIAAMLPLLFVGIGVMRGFAITTTLGVLIGVFITRPAFGHVAEKILGAEEH
ncbi:MAG: hypothetical protein KQA33_01205 [Candidatus Aenigmarchaeota archaeon]|nr:hypothetical protein [Candidatus Aenigmarchaeota archaeon]